MFQEREHNRSGCKNIGVGKRKKHLGRADLDRANLDRTSES